MRNLYTGRKCDVVSIDIAVDDELLGTTSSTKTQAGVVLAFADGDVVYVNLAELYMAKEKIEYPASRSLAAHAAPIFRLETTSK